MAFLKEKRIPPHQARQDELERELRKIDSELESRQRAHKLGIEELNLQYARARAELQGKEVAEPPVIGEVELQKWRRGLIT